eukprot:TRINITY_DN960_c0_g1_i2.p1 TRINITY_DN960_c0_g1~~TRINITY_DN960_c0_g1_i2.p1  ORF type:complete len:1032 (+),score=301.43 TRINITY_DN960_c0_g1_i2:280-3096(+)
MRGAGRGPRQALGRNVTKPRPVRPEKPLPSLPERKATPPRDAQPASAVSPSASKQIVPAQPPSNTGNQVTVTPVATDTSRIPDRSRPPSSSLRPNVEPFVPGGHAPRVPISIEAPPGHGTRVINLPDGTVVFDRQPDRVEIEDGRHFSFEQMEEVLNVMLQKGLATDPDSIPELSAFVGIYREDWEGESWRRQRSPARCNVVREQAKQAGPEEKLKREVMGLINRMTPEKYEKLSESLGVIVTKMVREQEDELKAKLEKRQLQLSEEAQPGQPAKVVSEEDERELVDGMASGHLGVVVRATYEAAVTVSSLMETYANLCKDMANSESRARSVTIGKCWFRRYLINQCQEQFVGLQADNERRARLKRQGYEMSAEEQVVDKKVRDRAVGNIRFVGLLFKRELLTEKIMHSILRQLVGNGKAEQKAPELLEHTEEVPDEEQLVTMAELLGTIGKELDTTEKGSRHMSNYMGCIEALSKNAHISMRVRFLLQNVGEMRKLGWKTKEKEGAKRLQEFGTHHERMLRNKTTNLGWTVKETQVMTRSVAPGRASPKPTADSPRAQSPEASPRTPLQPKQRAQEHRVHEYESRARELIHAHGGEEHIAAAMDDRLREGDLRLVLIHSVLSTSKTVKMADERSTVVKILRMLRDPPRGSGLARAAEEVASWGGVRTILADAAFEVLYGGLCEDSPRLLSLFVNFIQELLAPKDPHTALLTDWGIADIVAHAICGASPAAASSSDQPWKLVGKLLNELANLLRVHHSVMPSCRTAPSIVLLGDSDIAMKVVAEECKGADPSLMVCRKFQAAGEDEKVFESIKGEDEKVKLGQDGHCSAVVAGILAHLWLCGKDEGNWSGFFRKRPGSEQEAVKKLIVFYCSGREAAVQKECACFVARAEPAGPETHSSAVQFAREFVAWCRSQHIKLKAPTDLDDDLRAALARLDAR